jgi:hypothetical protein
MRAERELLIERTHAGLALRVPTAAPVAGAAR